MSPLFGPVYADCGQPGIAPEELLRAQFLQMLYSVRCERLLMEAIGYHQHHREPARRSAYPDSPRYPLAEWQNGAALDGFGLHRN